MSAVVGGPTRDRVYAYVRDRILSEEYRSGSFLEEEQVSEAVGVSRTPVREAFHRLAAERFIELLPRRGALVRGVTVQELIDMYETRRVLETYAARRVCAEALAVPDVMDTLLDEMRQISAKESLRIAELNRQFHRAMVGALGNEVLTDSYDSLKSRQQRVAISAIKANPARLPLIHIEHTELVTALKHGDGDRAAAILDAHLRPVLEVVTHLATVGAPGLRLDGKV
jgi:DNA-binding GntR family transcriptional regulator